MSFGPLPPGVDLGALEKALREINSYAAHWQAWAQEREGWRVLYDRATGCLDLAWLWEQGLRLAAAKPHAAGEVLALLDRLTHTKPDELAAQYVGGFHEERLAEAEMHRRRVERELRELFDRLGVDWPGRA